jgi:hypothetical protein
VISTPEERNVMNSGFDMQNEIAKLAECVVEPVAAKLTTQELEPVVGQIRHAFEELNTTRTAAETDFENVAVNILQPAQPKLSAAEFMRMVDRLRGAMVGFCQRDDWGQNVA